MNEIVKSANKIKFSTIIEQLKKRNINGYYCDTSEDALKLALSMIEDTSVVGWGGSVSLNEVGIKNELKNRNVEIIDPYDFKDREEALQKRRRTLFSDIFLMSTNAITMKGELVNVDGTCNRVAALCFGPKKVIIIAGANKVVSDINTAVERIKTEACPANAVRLGKKKIPCAITGKCTECLNVGETMCSNWVVTRFSAFEDRLHVILVNENLGF